MRRRFLTVFLFAVAIIFLAPRLVGAWLGGETRLMADSAYASAIRDCKFDSMLSSKLSEIAFGDICANSSKNDFADERFQERGKSIHDQLSRLSDSHYQELISCDTCAIKPANVVEGYLINHMRALKKVSTRHISKRETQENLYEALHIEALAQGYLLDAFAAGHILSYNDLFLSFLQSRNKRQAHNYHRDRGVYVINSRGDVWQTFGDGNLHWYGPTYHHVLEACESSLKELFVTYYVALSASLPQALEMWIDSFSIDSSSEEFIRGWLEAGNAIDLYEKSRIPTLSLIPMPVAATWSYRTQDTTKYGIRIRRHYPQLVESGFHDPDLRDIDSNFLYSFSSMPNWMIPPPLIDTPAISADSLLEFNKDWLSVRWIQNRFAPPNYKGLLFSVSAWLATRDKHTRLINSASVGYGVFDDLAIFKNGSIELSVTSSWRDEPKTILAATGGLGVIFPIGKFFKAIRFESGIVWDRNFDSIDRGAAFGIGLDTYVYPLKFTNAGITWRIMCKWYRLDNPIRGLNISAVLQ